MIGAVIGGGGIKCTNLVYMYVSGFMICDVCFVIQFTQDIPYSGYKSDVGNCFYDIPRKLKGKILMSYDPNWSDNIRSKKILCHLNSNNKGSQK